MLGVYDNWYLAERVFSRRISVNGATLMRVLPSAAKAVHPSKTGNWGSARIEGVRWSEVQRLSPDFVGETPDSQKFRPG